MHRLILGILVAFVIAAAAGDVLARPKTDVVAIKNGDHVTWGLSSMISFASHGGGGVSPFDFDWAPYLKIYYRFF